ncbi:glycosyltransferase family 2 protein [Pseudorhizobium endolithicum]|uniref:Glycosyltransferase family 2 protein n=1 Tax=Pseudorhizobium endolithicum TaxID=1191678 RepID=A0ABN7JNV7_9HYPH|nr:glycosyltransferase family A protein [Pseudorhizobium endolithicum]CAD7039227.1 glycosyltransferase family 2 protein [Pseudorhizobium endolithicum]
MNVSIIIKTLNEEKRIAQTIEAALAALSVTTGEIILADSGSSDRTIEIASGYPVRIVQIMPPAQPSCGIGPQLGYQYSTGRYVCLIDGDMELEPDFLQEAIGYLDDHPRAAGVTGHVEEKMLDNLEYARRVGRNPPELRVGDIDRMNGGGVYRRSAIEGIGYFTDRNLHCHEEFDLGVRLRHAGWSLHRLDRRFVSHYGHSVNAYSLLVRRWKTKYLFGIGEVLRASMGQPYLKQVLGGLPELRLWAAVACWMLLSVALLLFIPQKLAAVFVVSLLAGCVVGLVSIRKASLRMGIYTVVAWLFHTAALPFGYFRPRLDPRLWVESREVGGRDAEDAVADGPADGHHMPEPRYRLG